MQTLQTKFSTFLTVFFLISAFIISPCNVSAYEVDFDILTLYLTDEVKSLGSGGVDLRIEGPEADLLHPAKLVSKNGNDLTYRLMDENILKDKGDEWSDTALKSKEYGLTALINPEQNGAARWALAFQFNNDRATGHTVQQRDDFRFEYKKDTRSPRVALGVELFNSISLGAGEDHGTFREARFTPSPAFEVGIRDFRREFNLDFSMEKNDIQADIPIYYSEKVRELEIKINMDEAIRIHFVQEDKNPDRFKLELSSQLSKNYSLIYMQSKGGFSFNERLFINGVDEGQVHGDAEYKVSGYGMEILRDSGTKYNLNYRNLDFNVSSGGTVNAGTALDFWEDLLFGKRFFTFNTGLVSDQYHIGVESARSESLTLRGGLQYIVIKPEGMLNHWTPIPFIGMGRLDEEIKKLAYSRLEVGILTGGFSYRIGDVELSYALGQYIPISTEKREKDSTGTIKEKDEKSSLDGLKNLWKKIRENPGGTLQVLEVKWRF